MGNQWLVRQVVIRIFNSYIGKWDALGCQFPRIAAMPNARKQQREPKAKRLLGDRGRGSEIFFNFEMTCHSAVHVSYRRYCHVPM